MTGTEFWYLPISPGFGLKHKNGWTGSFRVLLPTDDDSGDLDDDGVDDGDKDENDDRFYLSRFPLTELHTAQV